jgi:hypothetical protein
LGVTAPCSYYVIDQTNNNFVVTVTDSGSKVYLVSITPGSYTSSNIVTQLAWDMQYNTQVVSGGGASDDLITVYKLAVLVDATTSQLLVYQTVAAASGKPFAISFPATVTISGTVTTVDSVQEVLGFQGATTSSSFASSSGKIYDNSNTAINSGSNTNYLYSPYFVQLSGPLYLILHSDLTSYCEKTPTIFPPSERGDKFEIVEVNANYDGTIQKVSNDKVSMVNSAANINEASFYFTLGTRTQFSVYDLNGNITTSNYLSFNGGSFLVGIRFFMSTKTINNTITSIISGDKYVSSQPIQDGAPMKPHENYNQGVVIKPSSSDRARKIPKLVQKIGKK